MNRVVQVTLVLVLIELTLGGGGRLVSFGAVSPRMVLFTVSMVLTVVMLSRKGIRSMSFYPLLVGFGVMIAIGVVVGLFNSSDPKLIFEDVKPLLFFLMLPFFDLAIVEKSRLDMATRIIKLSAVVLAVLFFLVLIIIHSGIVPFLDFYYAVLPTQEFFFRAELTFFYKGFLYICIGFVFVFFTNEKNRMLLLSVLGAAILVTLTRGFWLALALTFLTYFVVTRRLPHIIIFLALAFVVLGFGQKLFEGGSRLLQSALHPGSEPNDKLLGDRRTSDASRVMQILEVRERITPVSSIIGHGFGQGTPSRPIHMEISYLEIFHKQGVIGLLFWGYVLVLLINAYRSGLSTPARNAFFYGALLVFFQSLTNQFINNPIGLGIILLALVVLNRFKE